MYILSELKLQYAFEDGLPVITKDGQHLGSIGISGANPELDGIYAQAGIDAVQNHL